MSLICRWLVQGISSSESSHAKERHEFQVGQRVKVVSRKTPCQQSSHIVLLLAPRKATPSCLLLPRGLHHEFDQQVSWVHAHP